LRRGCVCLELDDVCRTLCAPMWWPLETADEAGVDVGSVSVGSLARLGSQCAVELNSSDPTSWQFSGLVDKALGGALEVGHS